ncbi:MAG TPA: hypothetical protein VE962_06835 [Actinomycetota bacterium]|jgi:DNA-binding IscR family transcriptional regulator|nr:hypothetical protein [Actinomycetota bacterium]
MITRANLQLTRRGDCAVRAAAHLARAAEDGARIHPFWVEAAEGFRESLARTSLADVLRADRALAGMAGALALTPRSPDLDRADSTRVEFGSTGVEF